MEQENRYMTELKKFEKDKVIVTYHESDKVVKIEGTLLGINYSFLSCIIMTEKEKVLVKNIITITRKRNKEKV